MIFFSVAHNPTELDKQGPDWGTQYRSVVFYGNEDQKRIATAYIAQLERAKVYPQKIVTQVVLLTVFYPADKLSSGLRAPPSQQPVHRDQRFTETGRLQETVSRALPRKLSAYLRVRLTLRRALRNGLSCCSGQTCFPASRSRSSRRLSRSRYA